MVCSVKADVGVYDLGEMTESYKISTMRTGLAPRFHLIYTTILWADRQHGANIWGQSTAFSNIAAHFQA